MKLDGSGYPIPETSGQFWKDNPFSRLYRAWDSNFRKLAGPPRQRPTMSAQVGQGPPGATPPFVPPPANPPVSAPRTPAPAPTGGAPATPPPSPAAAMGRINQAMMGPP